MENSRSTPSHGSVDRGSDLGGREPLGDAVSYWERRRIFFNAILAAIFLGWIVLTWPHFSHASIGQGLLFLVFYAVMANLFYSMAYLVDIPLQHSPLRTAWRRWRIGLWLIGTAVAILFTNYWIADEIYPYGR